MSGDEIVVRTRLILPRLPRRWLLRPRLDRLLAAAVDYPLTIVAASAGYGKSSALASFAARGGWPTIWYSLGEGVADPLVFLLHLVQACRGVAPQVGERTIALLEQSGPGAPAWGQALDALINDLVLALDDETILVLDDYHAVDDLPDIRALVEHLLAQRPPLLHLLLATRHWPQIASLPILQARGELYLIDEADLAFTGEEIARLFASAYDRALDEEAVAALAEQTGGWAIALQLIGQRAKDEGGRMQDEGGIASDASSFILHPASFSREALFAYLAHEVLARQPEEVQSFLLRSSILSELNPPACDAILGGAGSAGLLRGLYRRGLFLTLRDNNQYRFHPLFHSFLQERARATLPEWTELHRRAAAYFRGVGAGEQVLYHLLAIDNAQDAADELERWSQTWLDTGRFVTLLAWIGQLPAPALAAHPQLLITRGDAARFLARFEQALAAYAEAERIYAARADASGQARALLGQALVYLDTVQPAQADDLLRRAVRLLPRDRREERAVLVGRIAENRLNRGRPDQAARLYRLAGRLRAGTAAPADAPEPRLFLRMGRLAEARAILERALPHDQAPGVGRPSEAHREATVLLSLICALQGETEGALHYARQGLETARRLGSALFEAVASIRLGHALQLQAPPDYPAANQHYLQAMALADALGVQRTKAEAYLGLALLHGFGGDLAAAQAAAREGLAIAERSGDEWTAALLWTALGAVGTAGGADDAAAWLHEALARFQRGKDTYGQALVQLWLSIWHHRAGRLDNAGQHAAAALELAGRCGYAGLFSAPTLFGPRDRMMLVPLLLAGRADPRSSKIAQGLLASSFPAIAAENPAQSYHPGSTLRIQTFGGLRVWRGSEEIEPRAWQRKKASQMFGLLITNRRRWLLREQICEWLWPEEREADAETQFKVTLNALNAALEPARPPRMPPFYIRRQGSAYRFCPPDGVWLDVDEFEARLDAATERLRAGGEDDVAAAQAELSAAVALYGGDYLSDSLYEDWSREERERLAARFLEAATTLAEQFAGAGRLPEAIRLCEMILARDPCWEDAYVLLMRAYAHQGNRRQVLATYERCVRNLREHLDVAPLPRTTRAYEEAKV